MTVPIVLHSKCHHVPAWVSIEGNQLTLHCSFCRKILGHVSPVDASMLDVAEVREDLAPDAKVQGDPQWDPESRTWKPAG